MRVFQPIPLKVGNNIQLDDAASHHLSRVLRVALQEEVVLFNGEGGEYQGVITAVSKKTVTVTLKSFEPRNPESPLKLCLVQGISRGEKMDFTIQKAVELGVHKIIPLFTERSTIKLEGERKEKRYDHWHAILVSAAEQCGRTRLPELVRPMTLPDMLKLHDPNEIGLILTPHAAKPLQHDQLSSQAMVNVLIGPEGGFTQNEMDQASAAGFHPLSLGPRVLRTETAAVTALSILQYCCGDIKG